MASICLSNAAILRCESNNNLQAIILFIPSAIEVLFSSSLVYTNWGNGFRHLWLTAEGCSFFLLGLAEMLSHILPAVRNNSEVMKFFDKALGATSFIPILCYTTFISLLVRAELVDALPLRLQTPTKFLLSLFIPVIVGLNEVASFIGISYYQVFSVGAAEHIVAGFANDSDRVLWFFFMSLGLALLAFFHLLNTVMALYRLLRALIHQHRIETSASEEIHFLKGIVWITCALTLGTIETTIGFAGGGFGGALTRRIFKLVARACLVIGVTSGVDSVEDFEIVRQEMLGSAKRCSRLKDLISNPRPSTFRPLTPTASAFHAAPRAQSNLRQFYFPGDSRTFKNIGKRSSLATDIANLEKEKAAKERVTVDFVNGTPYLTLRFSDFLKSSPVAVEGVLPVFHRSSFLSRRASTASVISYPPHSALRDAGKYPHSLLSSLVITDAGDEVALRGFSPYSYSKTSPFHNGKSPTNRFSFTKDHIPSFRTNAARTKVRSLPPNTTTKPFRESLFLSPLDFPHPHRRTSQPEPYYGSINTEIGTFATPEIPPHPPPPGVFSRTVDVPVSVIVHQASYAHPCVHLFERTGAKAALFPPSPARSGTNSSYRTAEENERRRASCSRSRSRSRRRASPSSPRLSAGSAPLRVTPVPTRRSYSPGSVHLSSFVTAPQTPNNTEIIQESTQQGNVSSPTWRNVLRDSDVLGDEEGKAFRELKEKSVYHR